MMWAIMLKVLLGGGEALPGTLAEGLCFYLPFDNEAQALVAKGSPTEMTEGLEAAFVPGKIGHAVHCGTGGQHRYLSYLTVSAHFSPNIRPEQGTVAFWVRPDWPGNEEVGDRYRHFFSIRSGLFYLYWHRGGLVFSSTMRQGGRHHYAPGVSVEPWQAGEWHHLAITWQRTDPGSPKGFKRLFVDGELQGEATDVLLDFDLTGAFIVGGLDGEPQRIAEGALDELAIWERALGPNEIRQLFAMGNGGQSLAELESVRQLTEATWKRQPPAALAQKGNLLANSSYEVGALHPWRASNMTLQADPTTCVHGKQSARFRAMGSTELRSGLLIARQQVIHTFSLWLKAEPAGVPIRFGIYSAYVAGTQPYAPRLRGLESEARLTGEWRRYIVTGPLPPSPGDCYFVQVRVQASSPTKVWVDAAQLEEGKRPTPFRLRRPWEAGLTTDRRFHLFRPHEPITVRLAVFADGNAPPAAHIAATIHDVWGQVVEQDEWTLPIAKPLTVRKLTFTLGKSATAKSLPYIPKLGSYRLRIADGTGEVLDELVMAVVPPSAPKGRETSMGIHVGANETGVMLAKALGCGWVRLLDACGVTHWDVVEATEGQWAWEENPWMDEAVDTYRQAGLHILGLLFRTPLWASSGDSVNHPPKDLEAWRKYVRAVAEHFKGHIEAYEVWNEPYSLSLFTGKESLYRQLVRIAHEEVHRIDPQVQIGAPCTYWGMESIIQWTEGLLRLDLLACTDVFSFHGYEGYHPDAFERVRRWSHADGQQRELWNTEHGVVSESFYRFLPDAYDDPYSRWIAPHPFSAREAAAALVKAYASSLAAGCAKFFQYWAVPEDTLLPRLKSMSLLEFDNALRPLAGAWAMAGRLLDGSEPLGFEQRHDLWLLRFCKGRQLVTVAWSEGQPATLPWPSKAQVLNLMGNELRRKGASVAVGSDPIFIVTEGPENRSEQP